jgi:hypothetical protein
LGKNVVRQVTAKNRYARALAAARTTDRLRIVIHHLANASTREDRQSSSNLAEMFASRTSALSSEWQWMQQVYSWHRLPFFQLRAGQFRREFRSVFASDLPKIPIDIAIDSCSIGN